jgi:hypothetical protein
MIPGGDTPNFTKKSSTCEMPLKEEALFELPAPTRGLHWHMAAFSYTHLA